MSDTSLQQGGLGIDPNNPFFRQARPATISINQPTTTAEGAIRGKLRIVETGVQFDEMLVTFLKMPTKARSYFGPNDGTLKRNKDNLLCFSRDLKYPDLGARTAQSFDCASCPHGDINWDKWKITKKMSDAPPCSVYWYALFIDTKYRIPLQMFIQSKSKKPFEEGADEFVRNYRLLESEGRKPNVFDISFKLSTKKITTNNLPSYVIHMSDFKAITPEEREEFGTIYKQFTERATSEPTVEPVTAQIANEVEQVAEYIDVRP